MSASILEDKTYGRRNFLSIMFAGFASSALQSSGIQIEVKNWQNGNHTFITRAISGNYRAQIVSAYEVAIKLS